MAPLTDKTTVKLPVVVLVSALAAVFSGGVTWANLHADIVALQDRATRAEQRLDKHDTTMDRVIPILERLDERTAAIAQRLDREGHK